MLALPTPFIYIHLYNSNKSQLAETYVGIDFRLTHVRALELLVINYLLQTVSEVKHVGKIVITPQNYLVYEMTEDVIPNLIVQSAKVRVFNKVRRV